MQMYLVGGYVRDGLLGVKSKDIDFAVEDATYAQMRTDILARGGRIFIERPEFLAIRAFDPVYGPSDYTLCRTDGFYSDARRPDSVHVGTIYDDLARRDFTVNAIAQTMDGTLIDPHGGAADLNVGLLRCVGVAQERFREDALRLLRAVRFHLTRGFQLDPTIEACLRDATVLDGLAGTSVERVYEELRRCYEADSYRTIQFFRAHSELEDYVFGTMGLRLTPAL